MRRSPRARRRRRAPTGPGTPRCSPSPAAPVSFTSVTGTWTRHGCNVRHGRPGAPRPPSGSGSEGTTSNSQALEQIGTDADCSRTGEATYYAWYELVPEPPVNLKIKIRPGRHDHHLGERDRQHRPAPDEEPHARNRVHQARHDELGRPHVGRVGRGGPVDLLEVLVHPGAARKLRHRRVLASSRRSATDTRERSRIRPGTPSRSSSCRARATRSSQALTAGSSRTARPRERRCRPD